MAHGSWHQMVYGPNRQGANNKVNVAIDKRQNRLLTSSYLPKPHKITK